MTTLQLTHEGHQRLFGTKHLLREKVWWHGTDRDVEHLIRSYISCQAQGPTRSPEPLHMSQIPATPWSVLITDLCRPFLTGKSFLVLIDSCSRLLEVSIIKSTTTWAIIKKMKSCFAAHGLSVEIDTDNGSQFTAEEFE